MFRFELNSTTKVIPVQYCDIMRFMVLHNRHHKVSQSVSFFMQRKTVTILLRIRARGHFVMSITNTHESHYVRVLDNPLEFCLLKWTPVNGSYSFQVLSIIVLRLCTGFLLFNLELCKGTESCFCSAKNNQQL